MSKLKYFIKITVDSHGQARGPYRYFIRTQSGRRKVHSPTGKPVVLCLRPHRNQTI